MLPLFAQATDLPFFLKQGESSDAKTFAAIAVIVGFAIFFGLMQAPLRLRRPLIVAFTFLAGGFYVLSWVWPKPLGMTPDMVPLNSSEAVGAALQDGSTIMGKILQVLQGILLFLGVYSVLRVHGSRLLKKQKDWAFSGVLLLSMLAMIVVGYGEYIDNVRNSGAHADPTNWQFWQYSKDFLFDGMLQNMDAAMFSIIAFFILSAAYRAFRIRSIEATILLATALIVMLSLMGIVEYASSQGVAAVTNGDPSHFANNFSLTSIRGWIRDVIQGPSIRALEWGIGIGALSMGLRLWLSLEKTGGGS